MQQMRNIPLGRLKDALTALATPERAAYKAGPGIYSDYTIQVWPNRASLAKSIRMQQKRAYRQGDWKPVVALTDGEGY